MALRLDLDGLLLAPSFSRSIPQRTAAVGGRALPRRDRDDAGPFDAPSRRQSHPSLR